MSVPHNDANFGNRDTRTSRALAELGAKRPRSRHTRRLADLGQAFSGAGHDWLEPGGVDCVGIVGIDRGRIAGHRRAGTLAAAGAATEVRHRAATAVSGKFGPVVAAVDFWCAAAFKSHHHGRLPTVAT